MRGILYYLIFIFAINLQADIVNVWVTPNPGYENDRYVFHVTSNNSLDLDKSKIRLYGLTDNIVAEDYMDRQNSKYYTKTYTIQFAGNRKYAIGCLGSDGKYQWTFYYYQVNKRVPEITSISPSPLIAKDEYQNVYLYGENFKDTNVVEWQNGSYSGVIEVGRGFYFISSSQIKLYLKTTKYGTGIWRFRVKDGDNYSNWYEVESVNIPKPSTPLLKSPSNYERLMGNTQTLSWYRVDGATEYEVYLRDETLNRWIFSDSGEKKVKETSITYSGFQEGHAYVWNIKALNSAGYSGLSETRRFIISVSNHEPTLTVVQNPLSSIQTNESVTIKLKAYDQDGDLKQVEVDWNDGVYPEVVSQSASNNRELSFSRTFTKAGTYTITATAYDRQGNKSGMLRVQVVVFDGNYNATPKVTRVVPAGNKNFLEVRKGEYLYIYGQNFSKQSNIILKRVSDNRVYTIYADATFSTNKPVIREKSPTMLGVNLKFGSSDIGKWRVIIQNSEKLSNDDILIDVKSSNNIPTISITHVDKYSIISGTKFYIVLKAFDDNLEQICYKYRGKTHCVKALSGENIALEITPVTSLEKEIQSIELYAVDKEGEQSASLFINLDVYSDKKYEYVHYINDENISKSGVCGGAYSIREKRSVNTATGAEMFSLPLLKVQGLHTISTTLSYNSLLLTDNKIYKGWNLNYDISAYLEFMDNGSIRLHWNTGNYNDFYPSEQNANHYISNDTITKFMKIIKTEDGMYKLALPDQSEYLFYEDGRLERVENYLGQSIVINFDTKGLLTQVKDIESGVYLEYRYNENGKLSKIIDPQLNREVSLTYNEKGQLVKIQLPENITYIFEYNSLDQIQYFGYGDGTTYFKNSYLPNGLIKSEDDGRSDNQVFTYSFDRETYKGKILSKFTDGEGKTTTYLYDAKDYLLYEIIDANGNRTVNQYDQNSRLLISTTNALNQTTRFKYDQDGNIIEVTYPNGLTKEMKYDERRNLLEERYVLKDGSTRVTKYTYGEHNELLSKTLPNGDRYTYSYNDNYQLISSTTPSGYKTTYEYQRGRVTKVTYPKGNYIVYRYDKAGRLISKTAYPLNATTTYVYDDADRVISITDPMGNIEYYTYDMRGNKTSKTDAKGNVTYYRYDGNGNLIKVIYPDKSETTYTYDGEDRVKTITYANGATQSFEYDALGRVIKQIDGMGNSILFSYDALGNMLQKFDANGNLIEKYKYDAMQKVVEAVDYFNNKRVNHYNSMGELEKSIDPLGRVTQFEYDKLGRLVKAIDALNGISEQSFDKEGNLKEFSDPNKQKTTLKHDEAGNLTQITTASNSTIKYEYDANGLLIKETNGRGEERRYSYNKNGQVIEIKDSVGVITYKYDANDNLIAIDENGKKITMHYDVMDRLIKYIDSEGNSIEYEYDNVGNLTTLIYPDGKKVHYSYDKANRLTSVTDWLGQTTTYTYDNNNRLVKRVYPNGTTMTLSYDNGGRLISKKELTKNGELILEYTYEYDSVGNIIKESVYPQISPKELATIQMSYAKGNLLKEANRTEAIFDADDNMIEYGPLKLEYDNRNRLVKANNVSYIYNAQNYRVAKIVDGKRTSYIINPNAKLSQLLVKTDPNGTKTYYVYGLGLISQTTNNKTLYYHYDLRGSTTALTDENGEICDRFSYAPYGKLLHHEGTTNTPFLFVGKYGVMKEENSLYYMRARYYHETLRRFVNRDTLLGEIGDIGSLNRFGYAKGNMIMRIDPNGYKDHLNNNSFLGKTGNFAWEWTLGDLEDGCIGKTSSLKSCSIGFALTVCKPIKVFNKSKKFYTTIINNQKVMIPIEKKISGVYAFIAKNGKIYIGRSKDIARRIRQHLRSGKLEAEKLYSVVYTKLEYELSKEYEKAIVKLQTIKKAGKIANKKMTEFYHNLIKNTKQELSELEKIIKGQ
jgi:RHS repeat-associated protein